MDAAAESLASQGIGSIFLYTHEAHPAENYPHLTSMDQKFHHAQALRDVYGVSRPILVDSLDGSCHRAYGSLPNMSWIFNRTGTVLYRAEWTDTDSIMDAIQTFLNAAQRRKNRERLKPFTVERIEYQTSDDEAFYAGLARNGQQAVDDFKRAFPRDK